MNLPDAVSAGYANYFNISGRATRSEFWYFMLYGVIVSLLETLIFGYEIHVTLTFKSPIYYFFNLIVFIIPTVTIGVRRLHDLNIPGFLILPSLPAFFWFPSDKISGLFLISSFYGVILIIAFMFPGSVGINKFGVSKANDSKIRPPSGNNELTFINHLDGERTLANDAYKIYLVKKYNIENNSALHKYICQKKLFDSIDEALTYADELECKTRIVNEFEQFSSATSNANSISYKDLSKTGLQLNRQKTPSDIKLESDIFRYKIGFAILIFATVGYIGYIAYKNNKDRLDPGPEQQVIGDASKSQKNSITLPNLKILSNSNSFAGFVLGKPGKNFGKQTYSDRAWYVITRGIWGQGDFSSKNHDINRINLICWMVNEEILNSAMIDNIKCGDSLSKISNSLTGVAKFCSKSSIDRYTGKLEYMYFVKNNAYWHVNLRLKKIEAMGLISNPAYLSDGLYLNDEWNKEHSTETCKELGI